MSDKKSNINVKIGGIFNATNPKEQEQITPEVQKAVRSILDELGLAGTIEVQFVPALDHIKINDQRCDYSDTLVEQIKSYIDHVNRNEINESASFWELLFQGILFRQAAVLFTKDHLGNCLVDLSFESQLPVGEEGWTGLFKKLLAMHISLKNKELIAKVIGPKPNLDMFGFLQLEEKLIAELQKNRIDILVSKKYFHSITKEDTHTGKDNLFYMMRDGLFYELGIVYPDFNLEFTDLPDGIIQFRINDQLTLPMFGIGANEILVSDTISRLQSIDEDLVGTKMKNPANGNEATLLDVKYQSLVDREHIYKWDALGYFILLISKTLREERAIFVTQSFVQKQLDKLKTNYKRNIELLFNKNHISFLTKFFRLLVAEDISIRNMKSIGNHLLQSDWIQTDENQYIVFDDRIATMNFVGTYKKKDPDLVLQYVRNSLKEYISHKITRGQNTLNVFLSDFDGIENRIKKEVERGIFPSDELQDQLLIAIDVEIKKLPAENKLPAILTTASLRPYVRRLTQHRYPQLTVLAYQELVPSMNIKPIARLSFS